uniref:Uncharacterized protein n=1 Tax=Escherichia coli TaxID=562 RepID=A0A5B9T2P2_ECOLX|nr:hypothetical protein [Escherichia coli]
MREITDAKDADRAEIAFEPGGQATQRAEELQGRVGRMLRVFDQREKRQHG